MKNHVTDIAPHHRPALDSVPAMICITDTQGNIQDFNERFARGLQLSPAQLSEENICNLLQPQGRIKAALKSVSNSGECSIEARLRDKKMPVPYLINLARTGKDAVNISCLIIDITKIYKNKKAKEQELRELGTVKDTLLLERDYLREESSQIRDVGDMIGGSPALLHMTERIKSVARTDASVLISGESGVGKELVARLIHEKSERKEFPLVTVNCASIPSELFESEFFGHVKGAFSGAVANRIGRFELANKGTLFLDEVGEIPYDLQSKLLRTLQQQSFERVGENITREVDVRIIAATNRKLEQEVEQGRFREDLYYRISVFPISVPPLRKRKDDIVPLAQYFLRQAELDFGKQVGSFKEEQLDMLQEYHWPGNIRELKNVIERAVILYEGTLRLDYALPVQALAQIGADSNHAAKPNEYGVISSRSMRELERNNIIRALETCHWRISGEKGAAKILEMNPSTLSSKVKTLKIKKPTMSSLYERLGGIRKITEIINDLLPGVRSDAQLERFWKNRGIDSIRAEKTFLINYICEITGGPYKYTGRDMLTVHRGMGVTEQDWQYFIQYFEKVLKQRELGDEEITELTHAIGKIKSQIID